MPETATMTAFVAGMTTTLLICGAIRFLRIWFPEKDEAIDWENAS